MLTAGRLGTDPRAAQAHARSKACVATHTYNHSEVRREWGRKMEESDSSLQNTPHKSSVKSFMWTSQ